MACVLAVMDGAAVAASLAFAPAPDFRYVGLEPVAAPEFRRVATALGLGAGVVVALSGFDAHHALVAGAVASIFSAFALRSARAAAPLPSRGTARMAIVPWGVLVESDAPRILRWAAVRKIDVATSRAHHLLAGPAISSRVAIETAHDRFVGEAIGVVPLDRLVEHLAAYASEQSTPLRLGLTGTRALETTEPVCEALLSTAREWLDSAPASADLGLAPGGYRRASAHVATPRAVEVLRRVLRDRRPRASDPRAFAAILAAELRADELAPDLVALAQCPNPVVAALARQAARRLGVPHAKTGTLDEVAPFLFERDLAYLGAL